MRHVAIALFALGCGGRAHDDHGEAEPPTVSFTQWTAAHEFSVEHPPFVAGQTTALAAHVTVLDGHDPGTTLLGA